MLNIPRMVVMAMALSLMFFFAAAQDFAGDFKAMQSQNNTTAQTEILKNWEDARPTDPELFIAYFNFYAQKSYSEVIAFNKSRQGQQSFAIKDSATGKQAGFLNSSSKYDTVILQKGFDYIDKGIALYPNRLDMRFGKIYMLGQIENYPMFASQIKLAIDYNDSIKGKWAWKGGEPVKNPQDFFLNAMQEYITQLYNAGDDKLPLMREIAECVLKYNPDHVECLCDVALTFLITGEYDKALGYLLKAENIAPKDVVVLNNIAEAYHRKNDKERAKIYYKKIIQFGTKEEAGDAKEKLEKL